MIGTIWGNDPPELVIAAATGGGGGGGDILLDGTINAGCLLIGKTPPKTVEQFCGVDENERIFWNNTANTWEKSYDPRLGNMASVVGTESVAVGNLASATAGSVAIGFQSSTTNPNEIVIQTPTKNIKMKDDQYIHLNSIDNRFEGNVITGWKAPNVALPFSIALPVGSGIVTIPTLPTGTTADPNWTPVIGGLAYTGSSPLSAIIYGTVSGGRQSPARMWLGFGVTVNGTWLSAAAVQTSVERFRSNGTGTCSNFNMCTKATIQTGDVVGIGLRQFGGLLTPTIQFNYIDAYLTII
jgi:hypothetical protein